MVIAAHHTPPAATAAHVRVLGHDVREVRWWPGRKGADGRRAVARVTFNSGSKHTVPTWARHSFAGINGGTWIWTTNQPVGLLKSGGRWINRSGANRPAVGFYSTGGIVWGGQSAIDHGAANIISGPAFLVWKGVPVRSVADTPWANAAQFNCGPKWTDGLGCFRSCIVRFRGGRVGLVEIAYATMAQAARVLVRMHVTMALTMDAGGSSNQWVRGHGSFGITAASGMRWQRPVPDAIVVQR